MIASLCGHYCSTHKQLPDTCERVSTQELWEDNMTATRSNCMPQLVDALLSSLVNM